MILLKRKVAIWLMMYLTLGLVSSAVPRRRDGETIQNANEPGSPTIRAKREGFVDLQSLPTMMRGFADSLGRGFNSMVQQGQNLGHKVMSSVMHNMPNIMYGNWKPITSSKPSYPVKEPSYNPPPPPVSQYVPYEPQEPEYQVIDTQFQPILEPARPIYKPTPTSTFTKPEPIYKPEPSYAPPSPTPGPIYLKPFETQTEDSYGKPLGEVVQFVAVSTTPAPPSDNYVNPFDNAFQAVPAIPADDSYTSSVEVSTYNPPVVGIVTTPPPQGQIIISHIPEEYSQNPEHISGIAHETLFYKDLKKLHSKPKEVEGSLANYRPKPPMLKLRHKRQ